MAKRNEGKFARLESYEYCDECKIHHGYCGLCDETVDEKNGKPPEKCPRCGATFTTGAVD